MSRRPQKPGVNVQPLYGIDEISLPKNAVLIFTHPAVKKNGKPSPLYIYSGAMSIQWAYNLNIQSNPTIGGEVVQILSATAGPMTITGQTAGLATTQDAKLDKKQRFGWTDSGGKKAYGPNHELKAIVDWFRAYMEHAGSNTFGNVYRDERAIRFKYPERGWDFYLQVTELAGFRYDKAVLSPQWSITAEIVTDNALDYFEAVTMSSFTDYLVSNVSLLGNIGLSSFATSGTETSNGAFGNTGDFGSTDPFLNPALSTSLTNAQQMGDNFQQLVASWSNGNTNFLQGAFGALADNTNPSNVNTVYQNLFGSSFVGQQGSTGSGSGVGSTTIPAGSSNATGGYSSSGQIAQAISTAFEAAGIPGYLAVADAMTESSLNPDDRAPNDGGSGIDGVGLFQVHAPGGAATNPQVLTASSGSGRSQAVTANYPTSQQISDAVGWWSRAAASAGIDFNTATPAQLGQFAAQAQGPADPSGYAIKVVGNLAAAKQLLGNQAVQSGTTSVTGIRATVVNWGTQFVQKYTGTYSEGCRRDVENIAPGDYSALPTSDCSNTVALLYCWGTGDDHAYGTNGASFNDSTTDTMWNTATEIPSSQAKAGDMVIFGNTAADSQHVVMLMADYTDGSTSCFSFGANPPSIGPLSDQISYFSGRGYGTHFFTRLPV